MLPHLGQRPDLQADRAGLRARLATWFATLPRSVTLNRHYYTRYS
jgi:hypothetical protein